MIVVSDTSPITNIAAIGQLDLLRELYGNLVIPTAVYNEMAGVNKLVPGAIEVQNRSTNLSLDSNSSSYKLSTSNANTSQSK